MAKTITTTDVTLPKGVDVSKLAKRQYGDAVTEVGEEIPAGEYTDHLDEAVQELVYDLRLLDPRPTYRSIVKALGMQTPHHGQIAAERAGKRRKVSEYRRRDGAYNTLPTGGTPIKDVIAAQAARAKAAEAEAKKAAAAKPAAKAG